ncbi:MAG: GspE/PulE family protein [Candidatus Ratteibacteria bacterium]|jgi:type IV pilus assembly protein PilB
MPEKSEKLATPEESPVIRLTDVLLVEGINRKASDILIEPLENEVRIRYRVNGFLQHGFKFPHHFLSSFLIRIKVIAKLDISESRLPQDGRFKIRTGEKVVDFRVSVVPSSFGEKIALRILDKSSLLFNIDELGFDEDAVNLLKESARKPYGMILVCGPTGCGKTTTLYSLLHLRDEPSENITTVEDPVEYEIPGINQVAINPSIGLTFAASLRSILRQDPDIIMVGEIRDAATLDVAIKSALTGHLVLSSFHAMDSAGTITRLLNMKAEPFLITSCVLLVASQRLLRRLCPSCRQPYHPDSVMCQKLKIEPDGFTFYRPQGCSVCNNSGYSGRLGIIEVLPLTAEIKDLILKRASETQIRKKMGELQIKTLWKQGSDKITSGEVSVEEFLRVIAEDEK